MIEHLFVADLWFTSGIPETPSRFDAVRLGRPRDGTIRKHQWLSVDTDRLGPEQNESIDR